MLIKHLGVVDYETTALAMQTFTRERTANTPDELWMCEHPRVYTLGLSARAGDLLQDLGIPMVQTNRGGQITYHGPGQRVVYLMLDLKKRAAADMVDIRKYVYNNKPDS